MPRHTFIISDETGINTLGFRVMVNGIRTKNYERNPLVLWMHRRPSKYNNTNDEETEVFPIGLATNLKVSKGQLIADIQFDQDDPFAKKIENKVESGHIRMASAGLDPISWSEDKKYLLQGQKYATLTESELIEISICDIGGDFNAIKLYNHNLEVVELTAGNRNEYIPLAKTQTNNKSMEFIQQVAVLLGLDPESTEKSILKALEAKIKLSADADEYKTKYTTLAGEMAQASEAAVIQFVDANVDKKFLAEKRDFYLKLGKESGMEVLKGVIEQLPDLKKPTQTMKFSKKPDSENIPGEEGEVKTFADLRKKGMKAITQLRKENPAEYIRLYKAEYETEPEMENEDNN